MNTPRTSHQPPAEAIAHLHPGPAVPKTVLFQAAAGVFTYGISYDNLAGLLAAGVHPLAPAGFRRWSWGVDA